MDTAWVEVTGLSVCQPQFGVSTLLSKPDIDLSEPLRLTCSLQVEMVFVQE